MSSEVQLLTDNDIARIPCVESGCVWYWDDTKKFARAIEQAVRAQWAAEVAAKDAEIERVRGICERDNEMFRKTMETDIALYRGAIAERDSAQAEAKRFKDLLNRARSCLSGATDEFWNEINAALQPGESHVE